MKKKLVKALLSAALVLSILGSNFSYVGARNVKEGPMSEMVEEATTEEVKPEENIVPDTPLPEVETEDGQVDSEVTVPDSEPVIGENGEVVESEPVEGAEKEEVSEEAVATLSDEGEEEIPEITDERTLIEGKNVSVNHNDVCQGGGYNNKLGHNPNNPNRPSQQPDDKWKYWDYDNK